MENVVVECELSARCRSVDITVVKQLRPAPGSVDISAFVYNSQSQDTELALTNRATHLCKCIDVV